MTVYAVYTTYISASIIVAFGVLAFVASVTQVLVDLRYPLTREDRQSADAIELTDIQVTV